MGGGLAGQQHEWSKKQKELIWQQKELDDAARARSARNQAQSHHGLYLQDLRLPQSLPPWSPFPPLP